ncbi:GntR family transcriptional regulator / MocR family aminotransferase [Streptoalloteichus tenebrarius]|uniref:GntR family transcriptional regulator / MocR family aminotransferase n=1 Tax=Streptoalloteichus tenebrarius (strain ATCC 17920 / DSM 40477 / JCM 4838 / CBS 697.72 / NBRC 16177 / NCIMB 11028 / NRRL B-12390 / A12253. 1 / ISP 5477) TaxID=1933 RepID=A0ABT1HTT2_STRSD|nr:PLP-dependent aminotransferase family protein [Streptoalloteichus tenebrarius]MCP2258931.1 GntR family transcriptional regulator / MocR family aminotransferase [Streptoalloteichus tenebrarius]BFF01138.1 PLP-dependent aminotransferase family protein [Streptoalloteichus tenebrarius]
MKSDWATLRELLLPAVSAAPRGRRGRALEVALREAIRAGRLHPGTRLPATRDLAAQLDLARGTVTSAYDQLVAEGYLVARRGSGTSVAATAGAAAEQPRSRASAPEPRWQFDLRPGLPALAAFPRAEWVTATKSALAELPDAELGYPDPAGLAELRAELAGYLGRVRAVLADPADLLVTHGSAEACALLADVLRARGHRRIAVEDPGHPGQSELFVTHGLTPVPIRVDADGLRVDELAASGCRAVLVTPAHQFPLGVPLNAQRRRELVDWARRCDGLVIEDDYDAEHRYDRPALGAVQALDPRRVAYLGSVSKTLAPALRLGWAVIPPGWREAMITAKRLHDLGCSPLPQAAFARMLRAGGYDRHLRRTRADNRRRRDALLAALAEHLPRWRPTGIAAGLHVVLELPAGTNDRELSTHLEDNGVHAPSLSFYTRGHRGGPFPGLVLGYAAHGPDRLRAAVTRIAEITGA